MSAALACAPAFTELPALVDDVTGKPDHGLMRDAALEAAIDNAFKRIASAATREESLEPLSELSRLILRRSPTQLLKLELERRMRAR